MKHLVFLLIVICAPLAALAEPARYRLDQANSQVEFTYKISGQDSSGTMPISQADLVLDFDQAARSSALVVLNPKGVKTGLVLATQALKSAEVLHTERHPQIRFESRKIWATTGGATMIGDVTIRGVTQPLTLAAKIYRPQGSAAGDHSRLSVVLTGQVDRRAFGADGYGDLVGPLVDLRITARLTRVTG